MPHHVSGLCLYLEDKRTRGKGGSSLLVHPDVLQNVSAGSVSVMYHIIAERKDLTLLTVSVSCLKKETALPFHFTNQRDSTMQTAVRTCKIIVCMHCIRISIQL